MSKGVDSSQAILTCTSVVWLLLSLILRPLSSDKSFWWRRTGAILAEALEQAKYSWIEQCSTLYFYFTVITPRLGPRPRKSGILPRWRSFMTDDFSPIEYSWTWSTNAKTPEVRYSVEMIGPKAGTPLDPFNQNETLELVTHLQGSLPQTDWTWFYAFHKAFQTRSLQANEEKDSAFTNAELATQSSPSSIFLAFEHRRSKPPAPKAYFVPALSALNTTDSPLAVVSKALASLPGQSSDLRTSFPAYTYLLDFLEHNPLGQELTLIFLAIDCVPANQESRLKMYFRSPATDFASATQILRLGNPTSASDSGLSNLPSSHQIQRVESLFHAILPLTNSPSSSSSPSSSTLSLSSDDNTLKEDQNPKHQTAGLLYYFDCAPSQSIPRPKIYLPVRHYSPSDESAWMALKEWLREEYGDSYVAEWGARFENLMGKMGVGRRGDRRDGAGSEKGSGNGGSASRAQTYVSIGFDKSGKLNVTSYFGPRVYAARG